MSLAILKLEAIGDNVTWLKQQMRKDPGLVAKRSRASDLKMLATHKPAYCAKILGSNGRGGLRREFQRPTQDYGEANSMGSRGVFNFYYLQDGLYEIQEPITWSKSRKWYARIIRGKIEEIDRKELGECLEKYRLEPTS